MWGTFGLWRIQRQEFGGFGLWLWVVLLSQQPGWYFLIIPLSSLPGVFAAPAGVAVFDNVSRLRLTDMHPQITYV